VRLGELEAAREAESDLKQRASAADLPWAAHAVARASVLLAEPDELESAYEHVRASPVASRFESSRSSLVYGERLRRAGQRVAAREHLQEALEGFQALGSEPWERRARVELRASGSRIRKRTAANRDELTPQELQVALVVAEGVTNREAGARLFLSPKTIEVHLSRAYRKLGVGTRTELARRLAIDSAPVEPAPVQRRSLAAILLRTSSAQPIVR